MDFLKSAVASAIAKGPPFPYAFGERVDIDQSVWSLHNGTKKEDGSKCSIFSFDVAAHKRLLPLAQNALRKFRTLRHPGIVKVLDTVETEAYIYIATERISPLGWKTKRKAISEMSIRWGLYTVAKTLSFINAEASSVHGNVRLSSVYTSESGEWKLAGLDVLSSMQEDDAMIYTYGKSVPDADRYTAPEVAKGGWESIKRAPIHAVDSYSFAILIFEAFNGSYSGADQLAQVKTIPMDMQNGYRRLINPSPKVRLSVAHFVDQGRRPGSYFATPLIDLSEGADNLGLKSDAERDDFLSELETIADSDDLPEEFFKIKILPELLKSAEFGGGGPKVIALIMRIGQKLSEEEYTAQITPVIIRLFSSPDRALRVCLLDNLPLMIDMLSQKTVNDKIFPQIVTGFSDLAPIVREQTVKSVLTIISKLSDRVINGELLRHLAKTANDDQAGIRTNTTICLGKIAKNLGQNTRAKVLIAAFTRSLKDPFVHGRCAALMALAATVDLYNEEDCAARLLPAVCPTLADKEKIVRDQANKAVDLYLQRVRRYAQTLPDSILPPPEAASGTNVPRMSTPQADSSWTGWAISSFTNKLASASGDMQQGTKPVVDRDPTMLTVRNKSSSHSVRPMPTSTVSSPLVPKASTGTSRATSPANADDFAGDWGSVDDRDKQGDGFEAWGDTDTTAVATRTDYDDNGEPDFEGWLNAKAAAKSKARQGPLMNKGMSRVKSETGSLAGVVGANRRPLKANNNTTATSVKKSLGVSPAKKVNSTSATSAAAAAAEEEDWGDAWG